MISNPVNMGHTGLFNDICKFCCVVRDAEVASSNLVTPIKKYL